MSDDVIGYPQALRLVRRARGWTQRELAKRARISLRQLVSFENGQSELRALDRVVDVIERRGRGRGLLEEAEAIRGAASPRGRS